MAVNEELTASTSCEPAAVQINQHGLDTVSKVPPAHGSIGSDESITEQMLKVGDQIDALNDPPAADQSILNNAADSPANADTTTNLNEEEASGTDATISKKKSVAFASTKRIKQFDTNTATNHPEEELEIDFSSISKLRARKAPKRIKAEKSYLFSDANLFSDSTIQIKSEPATSSIFGDETLQTTFVETAKKRQIKVALLHSHTHTQILHKAMQYIHRDRDLLLESLLKWCGIFHGASKSGPLSSFLSVVSPKMGTRELLEDFHDSEYLDLLQFPMRTEEILNGNACEDTLQISSSNEDANSMQQNEVQEKLAKYGLEDDCPLPTDVESHALLWKYCLAVTGASCNAASLLSNNAADVVIHWGGGRHHAHKNKAGGFCYVNDIVLAIRGLLNMNKPSKQIRSIRRVLYIDLDIHHPDGVQSAFYATDEVLTASFHRYAAGFFPASSGSISEKGQSGTKGLGYNINVPLPAGIGDTAFLYMYQKLLFGLVNVYEPHAIALCVGADGLAGDALVHGGINEFDDATFDNNNMNYYMRSESFDRSLTSGEGWSLSPECLAECVRIAAALCSGCDEKSTCILSSEHKDETKAMNESTTNDLNEAIGSHIKQEVVVSSTTPDQHECASNVAPSSEVESTSKFSDTEDTPVKEEGYYARGSTSSEPPEGQPNAPVKIETDAPTSIIQDNSPNDSKCPASQTTIIKRRKVKQRKLLVFGGGGYSPSQASKTWLLCTAAACEGARPGMFWQDLPKDIPNHCYFPRYGPAFELVSVERREEFASFYSASSQERSEQVYAQLSSDDADILQKGVKAIDLTCLYIDRQRKKVSTNLASTSTQPSNFSFEAMSKQDEDMWSEQIPRKTKGSQSIRRGRRRKFKKSSTNS